MSPASTRRAPRARVTRCRDAPWPSRSDATRKSFSAPPLCLRAAGRCARDPTSRAFGAGQGLSGTTHLSAYAVTPGMSVKQGQVIGLVGTTGMSTGCHLHFEVVGPTGFLDPAPYLAFAPAPASQIPPAITPITTTATTPTATSAPTTALPDVSTSPPVPTVEPTTQAPPPSPTTAVAPTTSVSTAPPTSTTTVPTGTTTAPSTSAGSQQTPSSQASAANPS